MKYLIVGLGNIGEGYSDTRHNIGFMVLDAAAVASSTFFTARRYGATAEFKYKGRTIILLKPSTFMNLSGNAVRYWMEKEKIDIKNLLIIVDDLALPAGSIRIRPKGSDGGHNGLAHINSVLNSTQYARVRVGIGSDFSKGKQVNYVLGKWSATERKMIDDRISIVIDIIRSFATAGLELTMSAFNKVGKMSQQENTEKQQEKG
jgi:peptidyl-tRNA hydrolase, PTH1 family